MKPMTIASSCRSTGAFSACRMFCGGRSGPRFLAFREFAKSVNSQKVEDKSPTKFKTVFARCRPCVAERVVTIPPLTPLVFAKPTANGCARSKKTRGSVSRARQELVLSGLHGRPYNLRANSFGQGLPHPD